MVDPTSFCWHRSIILAPCCVLLNAKVAVDWLNNLKLHSSKHRHISSNLKNWNQQAFLSQAWPGQTFDCLNWDSLNRLGLPSNFTNLIQACISTTTFSILINGEPSTSFTPHHGIRPGCPLSHCLFVVATNELSIHLQTELITPIFWAFPLVLVALPFTLFSLLMI